MGKTVYILGAGFSAPAGFPAQKALMKEVCDWLRSPLERGYVPTEGESQTNIFVKNDKNLVRDFVDTAFPGEHEITFEDVFTLLDTAVAENAFYLKYSEEQLREIRLAWIRVILYIINSWADAHMSGSSELHKCFASSLVKNRLFDSEQNETSIISLNWDSLVEDTVYWVIQNTGGIHNSRALSDIDYCIYTRPLESHGSVHMPSTKQKAAGIKNIKLIKLHGSATWLRCPSSNHIYTGIGSSESILKIYSESISSPFIDKYPDVGHENQNACLEPYIITPTFRKIFNSPHIQTSWHNAFVELREAEKLVFIGYSMPEADFHFRTLLKRAVRTTADIEIILHKSDKPESHPRLLLYDREEAAENPIDENVSFAADKVIIEEGDETTRVLAESRYMQVFRSSKLKFDYGGFEGLVDKLMKETDLTKELEQIAQLFDSLKGNCSKPK